MTQKWSWARYEKLQRMGITDLCDLYLADPNDVEANKIVSNWLTRWQCPAYHLAVFADRLPPSDKLMKAVANHRNTPSASLAKMVSWDYPEPVISAAIKNKNTPADVIFAFAPTIPQGHFLWSVVMRRKDVDLMDLLQ